MTEKYKIQEENQGNGLYSFRKEQTEAELVRYHALLKLGRAAVLSVLSENELWLIFDVCNGTMFCADTLLGLWMGVEDGCRLDGLDRKWDVDGPALVEKLKAADSVTTFALVDAIEQFWRADQPQDCCKPSPNSTRAFSGAVG